MSGRAAVRTAIATYLEAASVPYLGSVFPARPVIIEEQDYVQTMQGTAITQSDHGSSCVAVVNITSDKRQRRADVGRGAVNDTWIHMIALELFFASTSGEAVAAQEDYDAVVDALVVAIRANANPGGAATVWSAGEFAYGVDHTQEEPYTSEDGMTVLINGVIRFEAWEYVAGTGV